MNTPSNAKARFAVWGAFTGLGCGVCVTPFALVLVLLVEVVHQLLADRLAGEFGGGEGPGAEEGLVVLEGVEAIVAVGDVAREVELLELALRDGPGAIADQVALVLGDAGLDLKEQLVLRGAREGAAFRREVRGDAQLPDLTDGGDGVEGVAAWEKGNLTSLVLPRPKFDLPAVP